MPPRPGLVDRKAPAEAQGPATHDEGGAYADRRNVPADKLVALPEAVSDEAAAALIFKGMTAQYLVKKTHPVAKGDLVLVHAAAGGVGQILTSWCKALGAEVVGTAGGPEKCEIARKAGADIAIDYREAGWPQKLLEATGGGVWDAVHARLRQRSSPSSAAALAAPSDGTGT